MLRPPSFAARRLPAAIALAGLLALPSSARADVVFVPPSPPSELQLAIDVAADGDVILVTNGTFDPVTIVDKELTIQADIGATAVLRGIHVRDLSASRQIVLRGLEIRAAITGGSLEALFLEACAGVVHVEECLLLGEDGSPLDTGGADGAPAGRIVFCDAVTLVRCTLTGGRGAAVFFTGSAGNGGNGIFARNSNVLLEACAVTGGRGGGYDLGEFLPGRAGGHGIETPGSLLVLVGGSVTGGRGEGPDCDPFSGCGQGGPGGDGLHITNGTAVVELRGATLAGGAGGAIADQEPNPGVPLSNPDGSVVLDLPAPPRAFAASSPVRDGEDLVLTFDGEPGDGPALLFFSLEPGWIGLLARQGVFALGFPLLLPVPLPVTLDAQGDAIVSLTMPALGVPGLPLFMQAAFVSPSDGGLLASPSATTVIDTGL